MYVFSYGTLKEKYPQNYCVEATLEDFFKKDSDGMYPILRKSDTLNTIEGFLIEFDQSELKNIDFYEDYPRLYNRIECKINNIVAWVYIEPEL